MKAAYRHFVLGIIITSIIWSVVLFIYVNYYGIDERRSPSKQPVKFSKLSRSNVFARHSNDIIDSIEAKSDDSFKSKNWREEKVRSWLGKPNNSRVTSSAADTFNDLGLVRTEEDRRLREEGYRLHAFNVLISSRLDYHRDVPDTRNKLCQAQDFPQNLPNTSVIICFFNEEKHTLLRTVHSVLDRTPAELLHEVLLVDDNSETEGLHDELQEYVAASFPSKVKLIKTRRREGLIRARIYGASKSTGQVLMFLDSHCEVNRDWLQPLLTRIAENRTIVVTPIIDIINSDTFQYTASPLVRGGFNWGLHFKWDSLPEGSLKDSDDFVRPIPSPTMAGGLFAIEREYFYDLGEYDSGMNVWGGENLEISFRIWMCGGQLEIIPCSRVGHIFRRRRPYGSPNGEDTATYNSLRAAHVWMDEYIEYYFQTRPDARHMSYGEIGPRKRLRTLLKCKSFDWYLKTVYPELKLPDKEKGDDRAAAKKDKTKEAYTAKKFIKYRKRNYVEQFQIRLAGTSLCVQSKEDVSTKGTTLMLSKCSLAKKQKWLKTDKNELVLAELLCLEASDTSDSKPHLAKCHEMGGLQEWKQHDNIDTPVYNMAAGLCLGILQNSSNEISGTAGEGTPVIMTLCNESTGAKWDLVKY